MVSTKELNDEVKKYHESRKDYEAKKKVSNAADAKVKELKGKLIKMLEEAEVDSYIAPGIGRISRTESLKVSTPKTLTDKDAFFSYIRAKLGEDVALNYTTVNYNSLNSLYNELYEDAENKASFIVPGLEAPRLEINLSFRKE